jgi:hypothetical protein
MLAVEISPYQSICLFGWLRQPILTLSWQDVKANNFTWRQLRGQGLTPEQLKTVQPLVKEWIQRGGIQLADIPDMTVFPVNPLTDFGVDLAELWELKCDVAMMRRMGISYDDLLDKGLTPQIMKAFGFTMGGWVELGFGEEQAAVLLEDEARLVFNVGRAELISIMRSFAPPRRAGR